MTTTPPPSRRIEYMRLGDIRRATRNPREHDRKGLAAGIRKFGLLDALILDERTGRIVAGHGRLADLEYREAHRQPVPDGVEVDPGDGAWMAPVQRGWSSRDDRHAEAALLTLNLVTERGRWDSRGVAEILEDLGHAEDRDVLAAVPYSTSEVDRMLADLADARADQPPLLAASGVLTVGDLAGMRDQHPGPVDRPEPPERARDAEPEPFRHKIECPSCGERFVPR